MDLPFFWSPLADLGLTLKAWYVTGAGIAGARLLGRVVYLATGALLATNSMTLAIAAHAPEAFIARTLAQAAATGMCNAAFSALVLSMVG